jgi:hypothetical protein
MLEARRARAPHIYERGFEADLGNVEAGDVQKADVTSKLAHSTSKVTFTARTYILVRLCSLLLMELRAEDRKKTGLQSHILGRGRSDRQLSFLSYLKGAGSALWICLDYGWFRTILRDGFRWASEV